MGVNIVSNSCSQIKIYVYSLKYYNNMQYSIFSLDVLLSNNLRLGADLISCIHFLII